MKTTDPTERTLYIPDRGSFNIYHFIILTVSALRHIQNPDSITHIYIQYGDWTREFYNYKQLDTTQRTPHISNALYRSQIGNTNNNVTEIFSMLFPNAVIIDNIQSAPPNCAVLPESECPNGLPLPEAYVFLKNLMRPHIERTSLYISPEYIYISRNHDSDRRHILNEQELFENCQSLQKFQKIILSDFTVIQQMRLFYGTKVVVAAHGAALVNTVFCNGPTAIVEITSDYLVSKRYFEHIAATFDNIRHEFYFANRHTNPIYGVGDGMAENLSISDYAHFDQFMAKFA